MPCSITEGHSVLRLISCRGRRHADRLRRIRLPSLRSRRRVPASRCAATPRVRRGPERFPCRQIGSCNMSRPLLPLRLSQAPHSTGKVGTVTSHFCRRGFQILLTQMREGASAYTLRALLDNGLLQNRCDIAQTRCWAFGKPGCEPDQERVCLWSGTQLRIPLLAPLGAGVHRGNSLNIMVRV